MHKLVVIAHDIRSAHNIGALFRTCEGLGIAKLYLTGYSPYPGKTGDTRLPHEQLRAAKQIEKTALGSTSLPWEQHEDIYVLISNLKSQGFRIVGLEQGKHATSLPDFKPSGDICIVLGREVEGLDIEIQKQCDELIEIPMFGKKESFNVVQAAAMCLCHMRFMSNA